MTLYKAEFGKPEAIPLAFNEEKLQKKKLLFCVSRHLGMIILKPVLFFQTSDDFFLMLEAKNCPLILCIVLTEL